MSRAIVFNGDETWEMRDLPVPDPQPGGAVLRVEATGLCHSDIDHYRGHVHTSWGGAFPSIPGHEIVGRIEKITPEAAANWAVEEGDRVAVTELVVTPDGYRIYGHDFSVDEGSGLYGGFAEHLELLPGSQVFRLRDDLPAAELTVFEPLSCAVTWVAPSSRTTSWSSRAPVTWAWPRSSRLAPPAPHRSSSPASGATVPARQRPRRSAPTTSSTSRPTIRSNASAS